MNKDNWGTPLHLFRMIEREMDITFTLDPCTSEGNRLSINSFYTEKDNGLKKSWIDEIVFMNPPYSRGNIDLWTKKARIESFEGGCIVVGLLPLRTAKWFRLNILKYSVIVKDLKDWIYINIGECGIYFLKNRVKFIDPEIGAAIKGSPNFDSFLAIWRGLK